jgi:hypothetical protein
MKNIVLAAFGAATFAFASSAVAQEIPLDPGNYWDITAISVDDGHFPDYADYLAGQWRKEEDYSKSKGWTKGYFVLANVNKRKDEPDLYLVRILDHVPTNAEQLAREKEMNTFMSQTSRQANAGSGVRAKYRTIGSNELLQEMVWSK